MRLRIDSETYTRLQLVAQDQNCSGAREALVLIVEVATKKLWPEYLKANAKAAKENAVALRKKAKGNPKGDAAAKEAERVAAVYAERAELGG